MRVTGPGEPAHLLLDVLDRISVFGIPYDIVRALAVSYHGLPRSTRDGDSVIWMRDSGKNLNDLRDNLTAAGYHVQLRRGDSEDPILESILVKDQFDNVVGEVTFVAMSLHRCNSFFARRPAGNRVPPFMRPAGFIESPSLS